jgi:hypothetical protein
MKGIQKKQNFLKQDGNEWARIRQFWIQNSNFNNEQLGQISIDPTSLDTIK